MTGIFMTSVSSSELPLTHNAPLTTSIPMISSKTDSSFTSTANDIMLLPPSTTPKPGIKKNNDLCNDALYDSRSTVICNCILFTGYSKLFTICFVPLHFGLYLLHIDCQKEEEMFSSKKFS